MRTFWFAMYAVRTYCHPIVLQLTRRAKTFYLYNSAEPNDTRRFNIATMSKKCLFFIGKKTKKRKPVRCKEQNIDETPVDANRQLYTHWSCDRAKGSTAMLKFIIHVSLMLWTKRRPRVEENSKFEYHSEVTCTGRLIRKRIHDSIVPMTQHSLYLVFINAINRLCE